MGRDEFDRFLSHVRTLFVKDKAREGLLKEFDERIYGAKPPLLTLGTATFEAVKGYKVAYDRAIMLDDLPPTLGNAFRNRIGVMRKGLPSTDCIPPVLAWYRKFGEQNLLELVELVDNKFSADWIVQLTPNQRISNMNEILKVIETSSSPHEVLVRKEFLFNREQPPTVFASEIYGRRFAKYVLLRLEYALASHAAPLNLPDETSVEHVLPQNPALSSQWFKDFTVSEHEERIHRLGNLMLLSQRKNASLSNLDFADKRKRYLESRVESLPNSSRLLAMQTFTLDDIKNRHQDLLERLVATYSG